MKRCKDCKDSEHENLTDDVELAVIRDPDTLKVVSRKNLCSDHWDMYLDDDYVTGTAANGLTSPTSTLRRRIEAIEGIQGVRRLDFLTTDYEFILVQMTSDVARAINGMGITTVQWESQGGMRRNFKVMAIQVPQLRADYNDNCGICHATN